MFIELCSISEAGAVGHVPGPNFGRKPSQNQEKLKYMSSGPEQAQGTDSLPSLSDTF